MLLSIALSVLGVLIKLLSGLAVNKIVAVNVGVEAFGYWGNILSLMALYSTFANGGITQGMIARLAAPGQSQAQRARWLHAGLLYGLFFSVFIVVLHALLRESGMVSGIEYFGFLPAYLYALAYALSLQVQSAALSEGKSRLNALILILGGLLSLAAFFFLTRRGSLPSAITAQVAAAAALCLGWVLAAKFSRIKYWAWSRARDVRCAVRELAPYVGIALGPALIGTASIICIRQIIIAEQGLEAGGLWQGLFRISDAIMAMAQAAVGFVMMPAVFRAQRPREILLSFLPRYFLALLPCVMLGGLVMHLLAPEIVSLLYSESFMPMADLLWVQFLGDMSKIAAMPFIMYFIYRRALFRSWGLELVFALSFVAFVWLLVPYFAVAGAAVAYLAANLVLMGIAMSLFLKERE